MAVSTTGDLSTIVTAALEARGVLGKIRAELRANVFSAIHEQQVQPPPPPPALKSLQQQEGAGALAAALLRELLHECVAVRHAKDNCTVMLVRLDS